MIIINLPYNIKKHIIKYYISYKKCNNCKKKILKQNKTICCSYKCYLIFYYNKKLIIVKHKLQYILYLFSLSYVIYIYPIFLYIFPFLFSLYTFFMYLFIKSQ